MFLPAYNEYLGPVVVVLWLATVCALVPLFLDRPAAARLIGLVLTVHWAWAALVYHAAFFSRINPAAWLFSGLFLTQAILGIETCRQEIISECSILDPD